MASRTNGHGSDVVLSINAGSSSVKIGLFELAPEPVTSLLDIVVQPAGISEALKRIEGWFSEHPRPHRLRAIGHRIVYGGRQHWRPTLVTRGLLGALRRAASIDPEHLPLALACLRLAMSKFAGIPQIACFDTAFHRSMPRVAQLYPLSRGLADRGVIRYGFHGLSCEHIVHQLMAIDRAAASGRLVIAHLGNGASLTAVYRGRSVETTMGFSPSGGLMMGTRCGDLDPMLLVHLVRRHRLSLTEIGRLVSLRSGLLGMSAISPDVRTLLLRERTDRRAREALALFCHIARKYLGALFAVLGGIDTMVFTGGIGEHAAAIRRRICAGLDDLGIVLDRARNSRHAPIISPARARVTVRVMRADENRAIARHVYRLLKKAPAYTGSVR